MRVDRLARVLGARNLCEVEDMQRAICGAADDRPIDHALLFLHALRLLAANGSGCGLRHPGARRRSLEIADEIDRGYTLTWFIIPTDLLGYDETLELLEATHRLCRLIQCRFGHREVEHRDQCKRLVHVVKPPHPQGEVDTTCYDDVRIGVGGHTCHSSLMTARGEVTPHVDWIHLGISFVPLREQGSAHHVLLVRILCYVHRSV
mmetsp:Transcript_98176/g.283234  ORF Transcript_98176/g.283234 Transcript_98176/m.283234 type:complete len:205 (-) Transcript_98176:77-691(-)